MKHTERLLEELSQRAWLISDQRALSEPLSLYGARMEGRPNKGTSLPASGYSPSCTTLSSHFLGFPKSDQRNCQELAASYVVNRGKWMHVWKDKKGEEGPSRPSSSSFPNSFIPSSFHSSYLTSPFFLFLLSIYALNTMGVRKYSTAGYIPRLLSTL